MAHTNFCIFNLQFLLLLWGFYFYQILRFTIMIWQWLISLFFLPQYKKYRSSHAHTNNFAKSVVNLVDSVSIQFSQICLPKMEWFIFLCAYFRSSLGKSKNATCKLIWLRDYAVACITKSSITRVLGDCPVIHGTPKTHSSCFWGISGSHWHQRPRRAKTLEKISYQEECKLNWTKETLLIIISWTYWLKYMAEELIHWGRLCLKGIGNTKKN